VGPESFEQSLAYYRENKTRIDHSCLGEKLHVDAFSSTEAGRNQSVTYTSRMLEEE